MERAYSLSRRQLTEDFGPDIAVRFDAFRRTFNPLKKIEELTRNNIRVVTPEDAYYPLKLIYLEDMPICLYVKGNIDNFSFGQDTCVSVVGTRKATSYGVYLTRKFAGALARAGCVIVSGMAIGIDSEAHETAIEVGGRTIAFLGCGVDVIYPPANINLYHSIVKSGGLVISEFPPGKTVERGLFIARNRLISGISRATLVVEGADDSGALITANNALDQGKEVFVLPIPLNSKLSQAPVKLLKNGAQLLTSPEDLLTYLRLDPTEEKKQAVNYSNLTLSERDIIELLSYSSRSIDDLMQILKKSIIDILTILSSLELRGYIEKNAESRYQLKT